VKLLWNKIINYEYFISILLIFIPLSIIFSRFALNAVIIIFFLVAIFRSFRSNNWFFLKTDVTANIFLFLIYLVFSTVLADLVNLKMIAKLIWILCIVLFTFWISTNIFLIRDNLKKNLVLFLFFITLFIWFDSIYQFLSEESKDIFGYTSNTIRSYILFGSKVNLPIRLTGPFGDEQVVGFYLTTYGMLSIYLIDVFFKISDKKLYFLLFINFLVVILSGERSSMIMYLIAIFVFALLQKKTFLKKIFIIFIFIFSIIFSFLLNPATNERFTDLKIWMIKENKVTNSMDLNNNFLRTPWGGHFEMSLEIIKKNPYFGVGIRNFSKYCKNLELKNLNKNDKIYLDGYKTKCSTHPHNYVLELLVETGIVGLVLFLALIFSIFYIALMKYRDCKHMLFFISIFSGFLFPLKPTGAIFSSWYGSFFWFLFAWFLIIIKIKNYKKEIND
jgi:O-antigen ligase